MNFPIESISIDSDLYPPLLRHIFDPPLVLYARGNLAALRSDCFGVVGTRLCTDYGKRVTHDLTSMIARAGMTVVSGMAIGVDSLAHRAALEEQKPTIAVVASGLADDMLYPRQNIRLAYQILEQGGVLLSEYAAEKRAQLFTFPARNRIISGMSKGVLVVEGDIKSGTMITAKSALDQGRDVFAVPGPIYAKKSAGTNYLIQKGAKLVSRAEDILEEYGIFLQSTGMASASSPEEQAILTVLAEAPLTLDEIIRSSKLDTAVATATLMVLELDKKVRNLGNGKFVVYS